MTTEFRYGDKVEWAWRQPDGTYPIGTVVDERLPQTWPVMGDYYECLPCPVAVLWDEPGQVWWSAAEDLRLHGESKNDA